MTKREAILAAVHLEAPDPIVVKAMIDADIIGTETYTKENADQVNEAAIEILSGMLSSPDISEGGYSIRYPRNSIESRIAFLRQKIADTSAPIIRGRRPW